LELLPQPHISALQLGVQNSNVLFENIYSGHQQMFLCHVRPKSQNTTIVLPAFHHVF
jgi:hypothetical protein